MKTKLQKILGIGLTLTLVLSLGLVFAAAPVAAADDEWSAYATPEAGADGDYFMDETITKVGPIARDIDGYFWAYVEFGAGVDEIAKSLDTDGRTWEITDFSDDFDAGTEDILAIVCSPLDADVAYAADPGEVYKTEDGGGTWVEVGDFDTDFASAITCLAVGWDEDDDPRVFLGIEDDNAADADGTDIGGVFYLYDVPFGTDWADLELGLDLGDAAGDDISVYGLSVSPNFSDDSYQAALVINLEDDEVYLASHEGSDPRGWTVVEILDDAGLAWVLTEGSDPVFPSDFTGDDFEDEDTEIFVGVTGDLHAASGLGGVVRVYGTTAGDYEILDDVDDDLISLAAVGSLGNMQMLAGADGAADVWYSWDDGENWEQASVEGINPTGAGDTHVVMDADFDEDAGIGWAAVSGAEGGVSTTIDGGTSWQGAGLLDDAIDQIIAATVVTASPETVYLLCLDIGNTADLYRYDSGTEIWTRLYEETQYGAGNPTPTMFAVFDDTIVLAEGGGLDLIFSSNAGQTFAVPDEEPTVAIASLLLIDEETWWIGDTNGDIQITDDAGDRSWDIFAADDAASDITSMAVRGDEALCGTIDGEVYYSEDAGETWDQVGADVDAEDTHVCFDNGNDNSDVIYAASNNVVARFQYLTTDLTEDWEEFDDGDGIVLDNATSIACSEGVVYVGNGDDREGVVRVVEPLANLLDVADSEVDEQVDEGMAAGDILDGGIFVTSSSPNTVWGVETTATGSVLWTYTDLMVGPLTGIMADPGDLEYTLTWDGFDNATNYEVQVYEDEDFRAVYVEFDANTGDDEPMLIDANGVTAGTTYWVQQGVQPRSTASGPRSTPSAPTPERWESMRTPWHRS